MRSIRSWFARQPKILRWLLIFCFVGSALGGLLYVFLPQQPSETIPIDPTTPNVYKSVTLQSLPPTIPAALKVYEIQDVAPNILDFAEQLATTKNLSSIEGSDVIWRDAAAAASVVANIHNNTITYTPAPTPTNETRLTINDLLLRAETSLADVGQGGLVPDEKNIQYIAEEGLATDTTTASVVRIPFTRVLDGIAVKSQANDLALATVFIDPTGFIQKIVFTPSSAQYELLQQFPTITIQNALDLVQKTGGAVVQEQLATIQRGGNPPKTEIDVVFSQVDVSYRISNDQVVPHYAFSGETYFEDTLISEITIILPAVKR